MPCHLRLGWRRVQRGGSERPTTCYRPCPTPLRHFLSCVVLIPTRRSGHEHSHLVLNEVFRPSYVGRTHDRDLNVVEIHQALSDHCLDAPRLR